LTNVDLKLIEVNGAATAFGIAILTAWTQTKDPILLNLVVFAVAVVGLTSIVGALRA